MCFHLSTKRELSRCNSMTPGSVPQLFENIFLLVLWNFCFFMTIGLFFFFGFCSNKHKNLQTIWKSSTQFIKIVNLSKNFPTFSWKSTRSSIKRNPNLCWFAFPFSRMKSKDEFQKWPSMMITKFSIFMCYTRLVWVCMRAWMLSLDWTPREKKESQNNHHTFGIKKSIWCDYVRVMRG